MTDRLRGWLKQVRALVRREEVERELDEELAFHIQKETEKNERAGMSPEEARRKALVAFRGRERYKEEVRQARWVRVVDEAGMDLRQGARSLARRPGFAAAVVVTLALGIGGTAAVFSVVRAVLLEPLPYPEADRLVRLYQFDVDDPSENLHVTGVHFREYRDAASSFSGLATVYTYAETGADLMVGDRPERVRTLRVSPGYFDLLGAPPEAGRAFLPEEETGRPVAVLSRSLRDRIGTEAAPGGSVELDGVPHTVVGIAPAGLRDPLGGPVDVWVPENLHTDGAQFAGNHYLSVLGRLAPGVSVDAAGSEMGTLDRRLAEEYPDVADDAGFRLVPLRDDVVSRARPTLLVLLGGVGLVLLIAVVNVANLHMVRSMGRSRDMAVRSAIGAGRGRIGRQVLVESLMLAGVGGVVGVALAHAGVGALLAVGGDAVPRAHEVGVDGAVLAFAAAMTVLTGLAFGLAPALRLGGVAPASSLRESARGSSPGRRVARVRSILVAGQVALALVLLVGATVLAASVYRLARVDLGFRTEGVLAFQLNLPEGRYGEAERTRFHDRLAARLAALPEVESAAAVSWPPGSGTGYRWGTRALTGPLAGVEDPPWVSAEQRIVAGRYFETLGVPTLEGRVFDPRDGRDTEPVAVVGRMVAERLFPGASALGQTIRMGGVERRIIGVVEDVSVDARGTPAPVVYHGHVQYGQRHWNMTYLVRGPGETGSVLGAVRREVAARDPALVVHDPAPLEERVGQGRRQQSFAFVLTAVFAALALSLAVVGLYGVLAYVVGERRREIGIRIALGARRGGVAAGVLRRGLAVTAAGLAIGLLAALVAGRLLDSLVFRTESADPLILGGAAMALIVAATAASLVPALRAASVSPRAALLED